MNPHEIAENILKWATSNGYKGRLATLQWICNGEETDTSDKLYNLPIEILYKASQILEQKGKAQLIEIETNTYGLKFL